MTMERMEKEEKKYYYIVKRYVVKLFEIFATSKDDAKNQVAQYGDPFSVTVIKEAVIIEKS